MRILLSILLVTALSACTLAPDFKSKSTNMNISGIGGYFTTIDPVTGALSPTVKMGTISVSAMNHKPGDGTQISVDTQKSLWSSEIGSQTIKINAKGEIHGFTFSYQAGGITSLSFDDSPIVSGTQTGTK